MNGCDFCRDNWADQTWAEGGDHDFRLRGDGIYYYDPIFGWEGITIKFCPMCGRALEDEA